MMTKTSLRFFLPAVATLAILACDIDPEQAPPVAIEGDGTIVGQVFFDANGNGRFDPVGGDQALEGATISLAARGDSARVLQSTTSGSEGSFTLQGVPVGTHELRARLATGDTVRVTCAPVAVTVLVAEQAFASTPVRITCRIDITEAERRTQGAVITVGGIVTAAPGVYRTNNLYLQDVTGGMQAFSVPGGTSSGIAEGDSVELTGPLGVFSNELQMSPVNTFRIVTRGRPVEVRSYSVKALRDSFTANGQLARPVGELVKTTNVKVRGFPAALGGSGTDARLVQGTDSIGFRLDQAANTQANRDLFTDAKCYDVTGILGLFGSTLQLKPRRASDVVEVTCPAN
jgi:hypothetical protein